MGREHLLGLEEETQREKENKGAGDRLQRFQEEGGKVKGMRKSEEKEV